MNALAFIASSLAADERLDPTFRRAFAPTQSLPLDRFREPDKPGEWDGPDPDERFESRRDERDAEEA